MLVLGGVDSISTFITTSFQSFEPTIFPPTSEPRLVNVRHLCHEAEIDETQTTVVQEHPWVGHGRPFDAKVEWCQMGVSKNGG